MIGTFFMLAFLVVRRPTAGSADALRPTVGSAEARLLFVCTCYENTMRLSQVTNQYSHLRERVQQMVRDLLDEQSDGRVS